jgi:hypothetical protein
MCKAKHVNHFPLLLLLLPLPLAPMQYPKETIHTTRLPIEFKRKYKLCIVILDCGNLETFKLALSNPFDFLHKVAIAMGDSSGGVMLGTMVKKFLSLN